MTYKKASTQRNILPERHLQFTASLHASMAASGWSQEKTPNLITTYTGTLIQ